MRIAYDAYRLILSIVLIISLLGCAHQPMSSGTLETHFCHLTDCNEVLVNLTADAASASCAFYDIDHPQLIRNLERATLIVDETTNAPHARQREGPGLMHHKFCVINHTVLVTGSFNPVVKQPPDYNNLIVIHAEPLAARYEKYFSARQEGRRRFIHNGKTVEAYLCPHDPCRERILTLLRQANHSIEFALFTFTDEDIAAVMQERHHAGVNVTGVIESWQAKQYNQYGTLWATGVPVFLESSPRLQHNKVIVIDRAIVITGSYNPTRAAATINDENILILHDEAIARVYADLVTSIIKDTQSFK
ncbi:hypothetical protein GF367_01105 [Candidatus Woesearchaeota archaeon]|nr:hypothetical protein [Candidatus Woesearchaeota archaeon]